MKTCRQFRRQGLEQRLRTSFLSLPNHLCAASTPDYTLYHYLCFNPLADPATKAHRANTLIGSLQMDKTGSSIDQPAVAASRLLPFLNNIKRVLTQRDLRAVCDHCGLTGLQELFDNHLRCPLCTPSDANGFPTKQ